MKTKAEELRASIMRSLRSTHTGLEIAVRRLVHGMRYLYKLYKKDLPGKPDPVFPRLKKSSLYTAASSTAIHANAAQS